MTPTRPENPGEPGMSFTVIIPSKLVSNLVPCLESLYANEPSARVIVIDDGLKFRPDGPEYLDGIIPFVFARACNRGILHAEINSDIVLLNDDALLKTELGLTMLGEFCVAHPEIGCVVPSTNITGQSLQWPQHRPPEGWRLCRKVPYVCAYLPRHTLDLVGGLDERYCEGYGGEDDDHLETISRAGLGVAILYDVFVDHASLTSTFRGSPTNPGDFSKAQKIFDAKFGATRGESR